MKIMVVGFSDIPAPVRDLVALAAEALTVDGFVVRHVDVPRLGLPASMPAEYSETIKRFTLTPGALVESWRVARHLEDLTDPGDIVLVPDYRGRGGVFALEQALGSPSRTRDVWTLAGTGTSLVSLDTYGALVGRDAEAEAEIDWEIVQYRFSGRVIAMCDAAHTSLASIGVAAEILEPLPVDTRSVLRSRPAVVAVPETVSRRAHTLDVLRAVTQYLGSTSEAVVSVTTRDADDIVWRGTTWDAVPGLDLLGERVNRNETPCDGADVIVLGDPYRLPEAKVVDAYRRGIPVIAPEGSLSSATLQAVRTWDSVDDLVRVLETVGDGSPQRVDRTRIGFTPVAVYPHEDRRRPQSVSVGIPIYRDVEYLSSCVESVIAQTVRPHEVVLYDDGSDSDAVSREIDRLVQEHRGLVRSIAGPNRGVCVARNALVDAFTGDSFVLLDSDDLLEPGFIEACLEAMRSRPNLGAVATWTEFFGGYEGVEAKPPFDARVGSRENPIVSTAVLIDMEAWNTGVAFAEDMAFLYCEDWHVWSQLVAAGVEFGLVPRPLVRHRVHPASGATRRTEFAHRVGMVRATEPLRGVWGE